MGEHLKQIIIKLNCNLNMNKKQIVRLTESDLHRIVKESIKSALNETDKHSFNNQPMFPTNKELPQSLSPSSRNFIKQYGNHRLTDNNTAFDYQELQEIHKCLEALFTILERFSNSEHKWVQYFFDKLADRGVTQESVSQIINIVNKHLKKDETVANHFNWSM